MDCDVGANGVGNVVLVGLSDDVACALEGITELIPKGYADGDVGWTSVTMKLLGGSIAETIQKGAIKTYQHLELALTYQDISLVSPTQLSEL